MQSYGIDLFLDPDSARITLIKSYESVAAGGITTGRSKEVAPLVYLAFVAIKPPIPASVIIREVG